MRGCTHEAECAQHLKGKILEELCLAAGIEAYAVIKASDVVVARD